MIRRRLSCLFAALAALCIGAAGCAGGQALTKLGNGLEQQFKQKGKRIERSFKKIGDAFTESSKQSAEKFKNFQSLLTAKYDQYHKTKSIAFFTEDAAAEKAPLAAAAGRGPIAGAPPPAEIKSDFLGEQTLERRGLRLLWKLALDGSAVRHADLNDGRLYVVTKKNTMFCIDINTGLTRWLYNLKRRPDGAPGFNNLYVVISAGDTIRVIDKGTGIDKWRFETDIQPSSPPFCNAQGFVFGCWNGDVCGFTFGDRFPRWRLKTGNHVFSRPITCGGLTYAVTDKGSFIRYDNVVRMRSGEKDLGGRPAGNLIGTKTLVFVGSENFEIVAYNTVDGRKAWSHSANGRAARGPWLSPDKKAVFYSADDDGLYALTATTGKPRWRLAGGLQPIAASGNDLYVLKTGGTISKLNKNTGKVVWSESAAPFVTAVSQLESEVICLISQDGQLFAVKPKQ